MEHIQFIDNVNYIGDIANIGNISNVNKQIGMLDNMQDV